ncbi:MAG: choice-of-anchor D domain-containing protein [Acidobacteria bacterium]|uniref:Choice-of-anchor D domain-containing protein n=1 Tax=Candidatus Polarisedimenticola svalbardensis TaxID=2886004 RepID=A0A8J7CEA0_9BACT|nr:choice-of-anchor D domain-containing protein [Candidatus Polarisedimenticola svalbardensis]
MKTMSRISERCTQRKLCPSAVRLVLLLWFVSFPAASLANVAPVVDSLTASTTAIAPGEVVFLQVDAHDPDCPDVCTTGCGTYIRSDATSWTADGGTFENTDLGVDGSPYTSTTDWRAPMTEGLYTISIYLPDSGGFVCGGRESTTQDIQIQVTLNPNSPPVIESLTAQPVAMYPGETSNLTCTATDPENDPLTYVWSADSGTLTPGVNGAAVFTADTPGIVPVTCSVNDTSGAPASANVNLSVIGAQAEKWMEQGLEQPQRVAADATGSLFVVDGAGSIVVLNLFDGQVLYRIPAAGLIGLDVDWNGNLLVGLESGAQVWDRAGRPMLTLQAAGSDVIDVAVDHANRRYGVLDRRSSKVKVYDEFGSEVAAFGSNGDGADQCRTPLALATTSAGGYWTDTHWVVGDTGHGLIKIFNGAGAMISSFGGSGGGVGEFINLAGLDVGPDDLIYASDSFQSWVQSFNPDGTIRETFGSYGAGLGQFETPAGLVVADGYDRLVVASVNSSRLQVFATTSNPVIQGPLPAPVLEPASLTFPMQELGSTSNPIGAVLRNDGGAPFGIAQVSITGDFSQTNGCDDFVDPAGSCTFQVLFAPTGTGELTGELRVETSAREGTVVAALAGTGVQSPSLTLTPQSLYFQDQTVGTTSVPQFVTVTNLGPGDLAIHGIDTAAPYLQSNDCPATMPEGTWCTVQVRFAPDTVGDTFPGNLTVDSTGLNGPHTVALDGSSVLAGIDVADIRIIEGDADPVQVGFDVTLEAASSTAITVDYATADDTAVAGQDYDAVSGTLLFAPGETLKIISVSILPDLILEPDEETFDLTLINPTGAVLGDSHAVGVIEDNEVCAGPNLLVNPGAEQFNEGSGIPGWTEVSGFDWQSVAGLPDPFEGERFFSPGTTAAAELEQMVDLSAFADLILAGGQKFEFEGYVRSGDEIPADGARIVVEYLHAVTGLVLDSYDSGEFTDITGWSRLHDIREAPIDTGWIRVRLLATRYTGEGNDAWFDGLVLRSHRAAVLVVDDNTDYEGDPGATFGLPFAIRLSCAYGEAVSLDFSTVAGTATENLDYAYAGGSTGIPSGSTGSDVPVTIYGDGEDEPHETFFLNLANTLPQKVVLQDGSGLGTITNDDFCPETPSYWLKHDWLWPVYSLAIGGVTYDQQGITSLLSYKGNDVASEVAREQAAAKLNLAQGSPPSIRPIVVEADEFLTLHPPGSDPQGADATWGLRILADLTSYNKSKCQSGSSAERSTVDEQPTTQNLQSR